MVVLDKQDCINKAWDLLGQIDTYSILAMVPTNNHKNKLIDILKSIKTEGGVGNNTYKRLYTIDAGHLKFSGLPKETPLGHLRVVKELANILRPLVGQSQHHIKNTQSFVKQASSIILKERECVTSYDINAHFTSVPMDPAISIIKNKLQQGTELHKRISMSIHHTTRLLEFHLRNTYFLFQGKYFEQVCQSAMGSPISPIVANLGQPVHRRV